jgi:NhaC family Na+:H+ antiporter
MNNRKLPHPIVAMIPVVVLIALLAIVITLFGSDSLSGGSQIALLMGLAVCVLISMTFYHMPWSVFERQMTKTLGNVSVTLLILLTVGMLAGSWMVSGVVPTLIYYGVQILSPRFFLVSACVICALVSLLSGSSWTTIATIGVALLGIGQALGISEAWTAGAIISGAYFGDKMSPLSDTTILASSSVRVDIFDHIRYMVLTTTPSILITLVIFLIAGFGHGAEGMALHVEQYTEGLSATFNISLWTLLVPLLTGVLIARKVPSLVVLFVSSIMAGITALVLQPHILCQIANDASLSNPMALFKGLAVSYYGSTAVQTGHEALNDLVSTGGMAGMLNTIWLILCAMCFGAAMVASGMIESITRVIIRFVRTRTTLVGSTVTTGIFLNLTTGDQFISIVLTADMFREVYKKEGYEPRLLSRTTEDAATVTSVLVPWNTCGMTQATVLGVSTFTYLPYCFFNIISPLMTILVAAIGWKIKRVSPDSEEVSQTAIAEVDEP